MPDIMSFPSPEEAQMNDLYKQTILPTLSLFTSLGTLVCCALPALFVALGMGAVVAGAVSAAPWLVWLSDHKKVVFVVAGILLPLSALMQWHARNMPCPADAAKAKACKNLRIFSIALLIFSFVVYSIGFFFAFLAADLLY
jgi:hypothetical protein